MFEIKNGKLYVTKGDTGTLTVGMTGREFAEGDTMTLTIRDKIGGNIMLQSISASQDVSVTHEQTKDLKIGACFFDIEYKSADGAVVRTGIGPKSEYDANCTVYPEVTE